MPASTCSSVVLPLPLGPITASASPDRTATAIPARPRRAPKYLTRPRPLSTTCDCGVWKLMSHSLPGQACLVVGPQTGLDVPESGSSAAARTTAVVRQSVRNADG